MFEERVGLLEMVKNYAYDLLKMAGYNEDKCKEISKALVFDFPSHYSIIDYDKAKKISLKVEWYENRIDKWRVMRRWLGNYILEESAIHHIVYALPRHNKKDEVTSHESET